jgi:hypothetical protein
MYFYFTWISELSFLLSLIPPFSFSQIFTESLLCSSRLENIQLAGQMMHCSASSINPPASAANKGKQQYRVSYKKSIDLVLAASREYFNSSTNLTDSCMDLARWDNVLPLDGGDDSECASVIVNIVLQNPQII